MPTRAQDPLSVTVRTFTQRFSSTRKGARLARLLTLHQLDEWGFAYDSEPSDAAAAIVAELAANAATHGRVPGRDFEVRLVLRGGVIRIEVADSRGESGPVASAGAPDSERGRGLVVVGAVADRWGVCARKGPGKTVWAEFGLAGDGSCRIGNRNGGSGGPGTRCAHDCVEDYCRCF